MNAFRVRGRLGIGWAALLLCGFAPSAHGQSLWSGPLVFGDGRVTISGNAAVSFSCAGAGGTRVDGGCRDDLGFFNYTEYDRSALRLLRVDVTAQVRASDHLSVLGDIRTENGSGPEAYGLYVRVRPWTRRALDIQIGRVPPTFGAFARRTYANDNILIGYPLAYQYLTSLRPDALPADADELLRMRARGWLSSFSIGNPAPAPGLPLANAFRWDTGVQVHAAGTIADATVSVTTGSLGNPRVDDDNDGKQIAGRVAVHPVPGLIVGASGARGPFVARTALGAAGAGGSMQTALGADVEYSRDYFLLRAETIVSRWSLPAVRAPRIDGPLTAIAASIEGRYKIHPRYYVAARIDHLGFSEIAGTTGATAWDAPVTRLEVGGGYAVQRNLQLKLSVQHNRRDGGRVRRLTLGAAQLVFWF